MSIPPARSLKSHLLVWLVLMLLLAASTASAFLPLGVFNLAVNLAFAFIMMLLVMVHFMDLLQSSGIVRIAAAAGFFWLMLLVGLALSDYLTRFAAP